MPGVRDYIIGQQFGCRKYHGVLIPLHQHFGRPRIGCKARIDCELRVFRLHQPLGSEAAANGGPGLKVTRLCGVSCQLARWPPLVVNVRPTSWQLADIAAQAVLVQKEIEYQVATVAVRPLHQCSKYRPSPSLKLVHKSSVDVPGHSCEIRHDNREIGLSGAPRTSSAANRRA